MKNKQAIVAVICLIFLTSTLSLAAAVNQTTGNVASGAGVFILTEQGEEHTHYFAFSVTQANTNNNPIGTFSLVCRHGNQIVMMIKSNSIDSFNVESIEGGLKATFAGSATVKMDNGAWQSGWSFTVTVYDLDGKGQDSIGITLLTPQNQVHCTMDPTPILSGNIVIKS